jgi:hypothetical protein
VASSQNSSSGEVDENTEMYAKLMLKIALQFLNYAEPNADEKTHKELFSRVMEMHKLEVDLSKVKNTEYDVFVSLILILL